VLEHFFGQIFEHPEGVFFTCILCFLSFLDLLYLFSINELCSCLEKKKIVVYCFNFSLHFCVVYYFSFDIFSICASLQFCNFINAGKSLDMGGPCRRY
jgi:hypothetical protein